MLQLASLILLCATGTSLGMGINYPENNNIQQSVVLQEFSKVGNLGDHLKDFLELVDTEAILSIVMEHLSDQEVLTFLGYVLSDKFGELIYEFQSMEEFKEVSSSFNIFFLNVNLLIFLY